MIAAPFHAGEQALQARAGSRERMAQIGPVVIRDHMPEQHRAFFAQLPFLVVGSVDDSANGEGGGQPWASMLAAPPGFAHSPDPVELRIDALPTPGDPLAHALRLGAPLGLLGIEPHTRRRNRMNGVVAALDGRGFTVEVQQSFGNCPKYIQAREPVFAAVAAAVPPPQWLDGLDDAARALIARADTFFIATAHPARGASDVSSSQGVDVSHRGGRAGFVRVDGDDVLTVPDFSGNRFFNTLGNLALHPLAGLLFVDFDSGELLHLAARARIIHDGQEVAAFAGAERLLQLKVERVLRRSGALPLRWGREEISPHLAHTGSWAG